MLVGSVLYRLAELVEFAEVFLPEFVDCYEKDGRMPLFDNGFASRFVSVLDADGDVENAFAVVDGDDDFACVVGAFFAESCDYGVCHLDTAFALAL